MTRQVRGALGVHLPFEPLWDCAHASSQGEFAERIGKSRRTVWRWKKEGVPMIQADAAACALGLHPSAIWGDSWCVVPVDNQSKNYRGYASSSPQAGHATVDV